MGYTASFVRKSKRRGHIVQVALLGGSADAVLASGFRDVCFLNVCSAFTGSSRMPSNRWLAFVGVDALAGLLAASPSGGSFQNFGIVVLILGRA